MIVEDRSKECGMFSKAGRLSLEMFSLLQEKDQILYGKKRSQVGDSTISLPPLSVRNSEQIIKKQYNPQKKSSQPFTKIVSRSQIENIQQKSINNGKFGMYNPKYHFVFQRTPLNEDVAFTQHHNKMIQEYRSKIISICSKNRPKIRKMKSEPTFLPQSSVIMNQQIQQQQQSMVIGYQSEQNQNNQFMIQSQQIQQQGKENQDIDLSLEENSSMLFNDESINRSICELNNI